MHHPAIITIARAFLVTVLVAAMVLTATIRFGFAISPEYWSDGGVFVGHFAMFGILSFIGWIALAGPYHWARFNRGEEGVGHVWAARAQSPTKFDAIRILGPYVVAAGLTIWFQQWITAPLLHRLVPEAPFSAVLEVVHPVAPRKGCSPLQLRDSSGVTYTFCVWWYGLAHTGIGSQILVVGTQSWFGVQGDSFTIQDGAVMKDN